MNSSETNHWLDANQCYLLAALAVVRGMLERYAGSQDMPEFKSQELAIQQALQQASQQLPAPSALDRLCKMFNLSTFERDVLLLCAGMDLDASFAHS